MAYFKDFRRIFDRSRRDRQVAPDCPGNNKDTELHPVVRWQFGDFPKLSASGFLLKM